MPRNTETWTSNPHTYRTIRYQQESDLTTTTKTGQYGLDKLLTLMDAWCKHLKQLSIAASLRMTNPDDLFFSRQK